MKFSILLLTLCFVLPAQDLDNLLDTYTHNSDLSEKTKLESGGSVIVFTRKDIETMQARNLKDLLKSNPLLRYKESRYGIADMQNRGGSNIFVSSNVRIYIDNQEFTSAISGSGFPLAGNFSLDAIDHVEIYSQSPSYEFSTEPTYLLIKMYSKLASRDRGGKIDLSLGSRGFSQDSAFYADEFEDFSYVASVTYLNDRKKSYSNYTIPVKRDSESVSFFGTLYTDNHKLQVLAGKSDRDTSLGSSPMGTNEVSQGDYNYFHIGYETSVFKNIFLSLVYQNSELGGESKESFLPPAPLNPIYSINNYIEEEVLTAEVKYKLESDNNRLIVGSKLRFKSFDITDYRVNGSYFPTPDYDTQNTYALFAEERYSLSDHNILNLALQYSHVDNNKFSDADLYQARLSHTYVYGEAVFKTYIYRIESLVEPYVYLRVTQQNSLNPQVLNAIGEEFKYSFTNSDLRVLFTYGVTDNMLIENLNPYSSDFINYNEDVRSIDTYAEYTYNFNINNKVTSNISYSKRIEFNEKNIAAFVRSLNIIGKFEVFNEVVYNYSNLNRKDFYDYSAGVKYHYNKSLSLSIKGENIFDQGYEDFYERINPLTGLPDDDISIAPIEQRVYVSMEYLF